MDPRLLAVFLALAVVLIGAAHLVPRRGQVIAITGVILGGIVLVMDLVAYT